MVYKITDNKGLIGQMLQANDLQTILGAGFYYDIRILNLLGTRAETDSNFYYPDILNRPFQISYG